ncbi:MBL fold metallo-hydrolase [Halobacillus kuroshimensis]|uniref:MBL fold metallo-hydrolase n=1 Tax=Halobacillus kuroshimensis TaxID=302481 RepID=A0ABS3E1A1_9BACI|nr:MULTISPECIES: MBL fold metallo-hydrolase [Halobacillus]MBN8237367.1 MBL fold metallo-hydrolase [Halobacillus kuroshimensis]
MEKKAPTALGEDLYLIDGYDLGFEGRTGTYVFKEESPTLIETGPSPSIPYVLAGLSDLGIRPEDVASIILTHIHLDHAGGVGLLLKECPNAEVIVHKKGKRHLVDPSRLVKGARMVYGDVFDQLFDPVLPVPEERLVVKEEGETLKLSDNRTLTFYDSPGHASHHLAVYDSRSRGVFTGDTAGIRYHQVEDRMEPFFLPTTSPNQFDPDVMISSMEKMESLHPERLYFGHYGASDHPEQAFDQVKKWIPVFVSEAKDALEQGEGTEGIQKRLHLRVSAYLNRNGVPDDHPVYQLLQLDFEVCAMGLADYLQKQNV